MKARNAVVCVFLVLASLVAHTKTRTDFIPKDVPSVIRRQPENPWQYRYGHIRGVVISHVMDRTYTIVAFNPAGTFRLNETIVLCGNQAGQLQLTTADAVVLIFSRIRHRRSCNDLFRIDVIQRFYTTDFQERHE